MDKRFTLAVHNLSDQEVEVDVPHEDAGYLLDLFSDCKYEAWEVDNKRVNLTALWVPLVSPHMCREHSGV
jgi:hypothetical protein